MPGDDVAIDADIPGPIYGNPNVPGKDQIGRSGPSYTMGQRSGGGPWDPNQGGHGWAGRRAGGRGGGLSTRTACHAC